MRLPLRRNPFNSKCFSWSFPFRNRRLPLLILLIRTCRGWSGVVSNCRLSLALVVIFEASRLTVELTDIPSSFGDFIRRFEDVLASIGKFETTTFDTKTFVPRLPEVLVFLGDVGN